MQNAIRQRVNGERGVAIVFIAVVATLLILFAAASYTYSVHRNVESELKTIAESGALAGAMALAGGIDAVECGGTPPFCTGRQRWDLARRVATAFINNQTMWYPGGTRQLTFSTTNEPTSFPPTWRNNDLGLSVSVERGRIIGGEFQSLEGSLDDNRDQDFPDLNPGIPVFLAANAVRVSLSRKVLTGIIPEGGPINVTASVSAIGFSGTEEPISIAPLAVHACALINRNPFEPFLGTSNPATTPHNNVPDFHPYMSCLADRLFTSTNRYCPAGDPEANCGVLPGFQWDPIPAYRTIPRMTHNTQYWRTALTPEGQASQAGSSPGGIASSPANAPNYLWDRSCFWATPRYLEYADNFGVFGLVGRPPTQADIRTATAGGTSATLGELFFASELGLTDFADALSVWRRIANITPQPGDQHLPFGPVGGNVEDAGLGFSYQNADPVPNVNGNLSFNGNASPPNRPLHDRCRTTATAWFPPTSNSIAPTIRLFSSPPLGPAATAGATRVLWEPSPSLVDPPPPSAVSLGGGTCNSMRSGWGFWSTAEEIDRNFPPNSCFGAGYIPPDVGATAPYMKHFSELNLWRATVPVIAEAGEDGVPCAGLEGNPSGPDPKIIPGVPYEVIGFVKIDLFDLDIGRNSPTQPASALVSGSPTGCANPYYTGVSQYDHTRMGAPQNGQNLGFRFIQSRDANGNATVSSRCNLIRGRLPCFIDQYPAAFNFYQDGGRREPVLFVEAAE